jgi:hypothetical protein
MPWSIAGFLPTTKTTTETTARLFRNPDGMVGMA